MEQESWLDYLTEQDVRNYLFKKFGYDVLEIEGEYDKIGKLIKLVVKIKDVDQYVGLEETVSELSLKEFDYPFIKGKNEKINLSWFDFMNNINQGRKIKGLTYKQDFVRANRLMLAKVYNKNLDILNNNYQEQLVRLDDFSVGVEHEL